MKRAGAADHQDQSESDMSDGISDNQTPATSRRPRVAKVVSNRELREAFYSNPYSNHPSLRMGSAAGFRRDILLGGVAACPERQEAINGREPRGRIDEHTDFDEGLAFPRPKKAESALITKMIKHTQEFVRQRDMKPEPIRMVFTRSTDIKELMKPGATDPDADLSDGVEAVKKPKHKKIGSRSKLGTQVPKRKYTWKDKNKNQGRKGASTTPNGSVPVAGALSGSVNGKSEAAVGSAKRAPRQ